MSIQQSFRFTAFIGIMLSSFLSCVLLVTVLIGSNIHAIPISSNSCEISNSQQDTCDTSIGVPNGCKSATLNLANSNLKSCSSARIFWNYPTNNLTLVIETPFTQKHQPYSIKLKSQQMKPPILHFYQVCEKTGAETELQPKGGITTVKSNADYQVFLKFQAPAKVTVFGIYIDYDVVEN